MISNLYERYSRQIVLKNVGVDGQEKLLKSKVAVAGVGGLGSMVASLLARMGVRELHIIDRDVVSLSDLHRQVLYDENDVGKPKVFAAKEKLREINSTVSIYTYPISVNDFEELERIISRVDVVADGLDNMRARYNLNLAAVKHNKPYVFASAIENYGNISTIVPGETPCLNEFYSGFNEEGLPTCATVGVNPSVVTTIASLEANEILRILTDGEPPFKGRLGILDLNMGTLESINLKKDERCEVCGLRAMPLREPDTEISCSKDGMSTIFINRPFGSVNLDKINIDGIQRIEDYLRVTYKGFTFTIYKTGYAVALYKGYFDGLEREALNAYAEVIGKGNTRKA
ncbi:MAG: HesA/MoeB/ThiF family protein [Nitrososphaeria archaeon]